ncbi:MarR family transcriptional regulator [Cellulomonas sp. DKR-3]|uniref:MarR family transcriptional regulator n=1 Tax=Cellulomonas fulva TaxID=2835530 RepID=A0ABS5U0Y5_9CELL|nr:MarR family transcriptional regulator [Cellulomonas fulva]MBT0994961.1 MarR family transcriptional regulator [Cellulomonas fulva]
MTEPATGAPYWYGDREVVAVLEALREFRRADQDMRRRAAAGMGMNETSMRALQVVVAAERQGRTVSPHHLARALGISTASTTKLLDRLVASGHLVRSPHPHDRRAVVVTATPHAHREIRDRLAAMHQQMADVAARVPARSRAPVRRFLEEMAGLLDAQDAAPLEPAADAVDLAAAD